jgi:hypothetical protein
MNRSEIKRILEDYYFNTPDPAIKLTKLAELDALPPAIKKQLKLKSAAPPLDFQLERLMQHVSLGYDAFCKADADYWKSRDPSAIPDQGEKAPWSSATNDAICRAVRKGPPPASRVRVPDFTRAREALQYVIDNSESSFVQDARKVLASIALREEKPREAIRWCEPLSDFHAAPRMAWAFQQLGDRKAMAAWLARSNGPTNRGFLAELQGDDEAAIRFYLEAIATKELPFWQAYGARRLRGMEARLGKAAVDRVKKSLATTPSTKKKLEITSVADFYARFADIAMAIREQKKISDPPRPMSEAAIAKLRLPTSRSSGKPSVPVPKSVATILRTDRNFRLSRDGEPLLGRMVPIDVERLVRRALRGEDTGLGGLAKLPASVPVWTDAPMPACVSLDSPGDQDVLLYMGVSDEDGEYPVARFAHDQPELWISDASLVHYILDVASDVITCKMDLEKAKKAAQKRNARFREGFSKHPRVTAILAKF